MGVVDDSAGDAGVSRTKKKKEGARGAWPVGRVQEVRDGQRQNEPMGAGTSTQSKLTSPLINGQREKNKDDGRSQIVVQHDGESVTKPAKIAMTDAVRLMLNKTTDG